jgi:hypothetical protein
LATTNLGKSKTDDVHRVNETALDKSFVAQAPKKEILSKDESVTNLEHPDNTRQIPESAYRE